MAVDTTWNDPAGAGMDIPNGGQWNEQVIDRYASNLKRLGGADGDTKTGVYRLEQTTDDGDILRFLSTGDVAHGVTDIAPTTAYAVFRKVAGATGGLNAVGVAESAATVGMLLTGVAGTDDTAKSTTAAAYVILEGAKINGANVQAPGANANVLAVRASGVNKLLVDQEGDLHVDGSTTLTAFDHHKDGSVARAIRAMMAPKDSALRKDHAHLVTKYEKVIVDAGLMTPGRNGEPGMANVTRIGYFQLDGLYQLEGRLDALEARVNALAPGGN